MELAFSDLRCKEVVNMTDGKRLGHPIDMVFDLHAKICGIVTPAPHQCWGWRRGEDILIPWCSIVKIGDDVILVNLGAPLAPCTPSSCAPRQSCPTAHCLSNEEPPCC